MPLSGLSLRFAFHHNAGNAMSTVLLMQLFQLVLILALGTALAVSAVRLMWIAGSYFKRKSRQLP
jgi:hypothetical protein